MPKYIFLLICLVSSSLSLYVKRDFPKKIGDDICQYTDPETYFTHVKFCEEGKYCKKLKTSSGDNIYTCQNITTIIPLKTYEESCDSDFECETGLYCQRGTITGKCSPKDSCPDNYILVQKDDGAWECRSNKNTGLTYIQYFNDQTYGDDYFSYNPGYLKISGKLHVKELTDKNYKVEKIEESTIGSVPNGEFVYNELACESGFALYFYGNKELEDPYTGTGSSNGNMFKKCVTVNSIEITNNADCRIIYDGGKIYNVGQLELEDKYTLKGTRYSHIELTSNDPPYTSTYYNELCQEHLMTKLEMFKRYKDRFKEKLDNCTFKDNYNEPETCNDDILRKWLHFYNYPEDYLLYYDDEEKDNEIAKFLIQQEYNLYQFSGFLKIKYFIPLLFLFAL